MITDIKRYSCTILRAGRIKLMVRGYRATFYPFTYTFEECIEEYCETMGWELNVATVDGPDSPLQAWGVLSFQRPKGE